MVEKNKMKNYNYRVGQKVFLTQLKAEGVIVRFDGKDMVFVKVNDDIIPVFTEDITDKFPVEEKQQESHVYIPPIQKQNYSGVSLSLLPHKNKDGDIETFRALIVNATAVFFEIEYSFSFNTFKNEVKKISAAPQSVTEIHCFAFDELNESPQFNFEFVQKNLVSRRKKIVQKLKAKSFYDKQGTIPLIDQDGFVYQFFTDWNLLFELETEHTQPLNHADLEKMMKAVKQEKHLEKTKIEIPTEIDLHIEKLTRQHKHLSNAEMLQIQLQAFEKALDQAIINRVGVFYAIHGLGTGKLKNEIAVLLKQNKFVLQFNNNFHPRYGMGATEIVLKK